MNALYVIDKYLEIKAGRMPERPVTVIFGAKAAPAYVMAKHIIHLILCLQKLIAVGFVVELLRIEAVKGFQFRFFQDFRMQRGHPIVAVKQGAKERFCARLKETQGVTLDPQSIFAL